VNAKQAIEHINKSFEIAATEVGDVDDERRRGLNVNFTFVYASGSGLRVQLPIFAADEPQKVNAYETPRAGYSGSEEGNVIPGTVLFNDGSTGFGLISVDDLAACVVNRAAPKEERA